MPRYRSAALATLATLLLAACGGDRESGAGPAPTTIGHKFGTTEIPKPPKRVVTVGYSEQDTVLALGVTPVGEREFLGGYDYLDRPWAQDLLTGAKPQVVGSEELNFERIAALRPDVLIGTNSGMSARDYKSLSKIAPTVPQTDEFIDFGVPWQEQALMAGTALGREERAKKLVSDVEARFARARKQHPEFEGKTAALAYGSGGGKFGAYSSQDYRSRFLADLGFKTPRAVDRLAGKSFYVDFSKEQIRLMDQDVLVMFAKESDVAGDPLYRRLDAVKEGRVIYLDLEDQLAGALGFGSALSLPFAVDGFAPKLAQAVDGDPATKVEQPR